MQDEDKNPTTASPIEPVVMCFDDAIAIAKGCLDYLGGYHDAEELDIYHHGVQTVINALEGAKKRGLNDSQVATIYNIGKNT
jgi:hypothetical protein